jgi:hypothetical protein
MGICMVCVFRFFVLGRSEGRKVLRSIHGARAKGSVSEVAAQHSALSTHGKCLWCT